MATTITQRCLFCGHEWVSANADHCEQCGGHCQPIKTTTRHREERLREREARNAANRQAAADIYFAAHADVGDKMEILTRLLEDAPPPGSDSDWCRAASMNFVSDRLAEILEFIGGG